MRIFFVCQRVPYPPDRGDKIATYNEIRHLAKQHELHVFCLADGRADLANVPALNEYAASVTAVPVGAAPSRLRALQALVSGRPLSVAAFDEPALHRAIIARFDEMRPDLIIVYSGNVAQYVDRFADMPRIMQFHDLDSLKWAQYAERSSILLRWLYRIEAKRLQAYEGGIARRFSHSLVCTGAELDDFRRLFPGAAVSVVGNGVDLDHFRSAGAAKQRGEIVFTGVMDYFPNVDAVAWFCERILPLIQAQMPEASLTICGARPAAKVKRLASRPGVQVTGRVLDTRPYLDRAEVFAAPLRMARGVQNKVLEAMAMGLPCVVSSAAWRGTVIPQGQGLLVSDDPDEFAAQIVRLLRDDGFRAEMARKAREAVEASYRWEVQMQVLDRVAASVTAPPPPQRVPVAAITRAQPL